MGFWVLSLLSSLDLKAGRGEAVVDGRGEGGSNIRS